VRVMFYDTAGAPFNGFGSPGNVLFPGGTWERKLAERRAFFEEYIEREVPLGRFGQPEEIAYTVVFLVSPAAAYINGISLAVDGGKTGCL